jgi:hypothetical protein
MKNSLWTIYVGKAIISAQQLLSLLRAYSQQVNTTHHDGSLQKILIKIDGLPPADWTLQSDLSLVKLAIKNVL